jgi:hypothetical protein
VAGYNVGADEAPDDVGPVVFSALGAVVLVTG